MFERPTNALQIFQYSKDTEDEADNDIIGGNGLVVGGASCRHLVFCSANLPIGIALDEIGGIQIHGSRLDWSGDYRNGESEDSENGLELHLG